jgi:hypothetical protein
MAPQTNDTVERLRADIDSGRTRDKIPASDPAAAPLGTDEEAAGTPISVERVALARSHEVAGPPREETKGGALVYVAMLASVAIVIVGAAAYLLQNH